MESFKQEPKFDQSNNREKIKRSKLSAIAAVLFAAWPGSVESIEIPEETSWLQGIEILQDAITDEVEWGGSIYN
ncbi:MAG: hypothetical protein ACI9VM_000804 [Candidatus Azotimanducaceae bacterium]|jgi:hypothetical protein